MNEFEASKDGSKKLTDQKVEIWKIEWMKM
jgi:hypothetical protein